MHYNFIEIGTSDFDTLIQSTKGQKGISVEAVKYYLDRLPDSPTVTKLNRVMSDFEGEMTVFWVNDEICEKHNLPHWVRGCGSVGVRHNTVHNLLGEKHDDIVLQSQVKTITWESLISENEVTSIDNIKIDAEGHDLIILEEYYKLVKNNPNLKAKRIDFEHNSIPQHKNKKLTDIKLLFSEIGYTLRDKGNNRDYSFT